MTRKKKDSEEMSFEHTAKKMMALTMKAITWQRI